MQDLTAQIAAERDMLAEKVQLLERRYNGEHQRGLDLELAGQIAENRCARLEEECLLLRQQLAERHPDPTPEPEKN